MSKIKKWNSSVNDAVKEIADYQNGKKKPFNTGVDHLNENLLGGIYLGDIILIAGLPASGKTHLLKTIEDNLFALNPDSNIVLLRFNWEMSVRKLIARRLKNETGLKMTEILLKPPTNKPLFKSIIDKERNGNIFHEEEPLTPEEFIEEVSDFCKEHADKDGIIITIDHIALAKVKSGEKKSTIDRIVEACLYLKQIYKNVTFIIISQLNRDIRDRTNITELAPKPSDLYASSTMEFGADLIICPHIPKNLGHEKYLSVSKYKYKYLEQYFIQDGSESKREKKYANFETANTIFYHYLKVREPDEQDYRDIFAEHLVKKTMSDIEWQRDKIPTAEELLSGNNNNNKEEEESDDCPF